MPKIRINWLSRKTELLRINTNLFLRREFTEKYFSSPKSSESRIFFGISRRTIISSLMKMSYVSIYGIESKSYFDVSADLLSEDFNIASFPISLSVSLFPNPISSSKSRFFEELFK